MTTSIGDLLDTLTAPGELYEKLADNTVVCHACGHRCKIREGKRGICQVRFNVEGELRVPHGYVEDLSLEDSRKTPDLIIDNTRRLHEIGKPKEVLTVDNHADGPYIYLRMLKKNPERAGAVMELLKWNEGNNSGRGIGCVSWDGAVHADQFWRHYSFGNVKERPFSEIWMDTANPLMGKLKEKKRHVTGRCAQCRWLDICGGNFRVRAEAVTGDVWAPDPDCYLSDEEIALTHTSASCEQL